MQIDDVMALVDEYVSASIEDHGYRSGAASAEYLEDTKRKLLAAIAALIAAPAAPQQAEPVAKIIRNDSGQVRMVDGSGEPFDMFAHVGQSYYAHPPAAEVQRLREALHQISLVSQNSAGSKDECGRIARRALEGGE